MHILIVCALFYGATQILCFLNDLVLVVIDPFSQEMEDYGALQGELQLFYKQLLCLNFSVLPLKNKDLSIIDAVIKWKNQSRISSFDRDLYACCVPFWFLISSLSFSAICMYILIIYSNRIGGSGMGLGSKTRIYYIWLHVFLRSFLVMQFWLLIFFLFLSFVMGFTHESYFQCTSYWCFKASKTVL